jgi:hypothetical protein
MLRQLRRLTSGMCRALGLADTDDSESDDDGTWSEDDVATPIDDIDPFVLFADSLIAVQTSSVQRFQALLAQTDAQVCFEVNLVAMGVSKSQFKAPQVAHERRCR